MTIAVILLLYVVGCYSQSYPTCDIPKTVAWMPATGGLLPLEKINGTNLYTGIYYKISMKKFPMGVVTWTQTALPEGGGNYAQIDINPSNLPNYVKGGKWFDDVQWFLEPAAEKKGSYLMRNKARPTAAINNKKDVINGSNYQVLILKNDITGPETDRKNSHMKVIMTDDNSTYKYQVKLDNFPEGTITWTDKKYGDHSHYLQVSEVADHKAKYQKGQEWWDDTLFSFIPEFDGLHIVSFLSHLEFGDVLSNYAKSVKTHVQESPKYFTSTGNMTISSEDVTAIKDSYGYLSLNEPVLTGALKMGLSSLFSMPGLRVWDSIYAPRWRVSAEPGKVHTAQAHPVPAEITKKIEVLPGVKAVGVTFVTQLLENIQLPFKAMMLISGVAERMKTDHSWETAEGILPPEVIMEFLVQNGVAKGDLVIVGDKVMKNVEGVLKGNFVIGFDIVGAPLK